MSTEAMRAALAELMRHFPTDSDMSELGWNVGEIEAACSAHDAARAALAQRADEPVAWLTKAAWGTSVSIEKPDFGKSTWKAPQPELIALYTAAPAAPAYVPLSAALRAGRPDAPAPLPYVPLTDEEIGDAFHAARNAKLGASQDNSKHRLSVSEIARAIESLVVARMRGEVE